MDITGHRIHQVDPASPAQTLHTVQLDREVTCLCPTKDERVLVGLRDGVGLLSPDGDLQMIASVNDPRVRMNDGKCDPRGRFVVGTMGFNLETGISGLYRLDPSGKLEQLVSDLTISNGLAWPSDDRMYFIDTPTGRIDLFDYDIDQAQLSNRRPFITAEPGNGLPDGMTLDIDGNLWVAFWGGGAVRVFDPDATVLEEIRLPVTNVTSCTFGGPKLDQLYITTAIGDTDPASEPLAGQVFVTDAGTRGSSPNAWSW